MRHYEEPVVAHCRTCARPYCSRCLVYSFGPQKPPFCVGCALTASGVRNKSKPIPVAAAAEPGPDRKAERAARKAEKAEAKANARAMKRAAKQGDAAALPEAPRATNVPVPKGLPTPSARFAPQPEHAAS